MLLCLELKFSSPLMGIKILFKKSLKKIVCVCFMVKALLTYNFNIFRIYGSFSFAKC